MGQARGGTGAKWAGGCWETQTRAGATSHNGSSGDLHDRAALRGGPLGNAGGEYREWAPRRVRGLAGGNEVQRA
jgi:hypothetical protein